MVNVLVAEDEKPMAHALELKLTKAGFKPTIAENGQVALDLLSSGHYDLLLLDIIMPVVNGFAVLEQIKKSGKYKMPIIMTTNLGQEEDRKRAMDLGAVDYIIKSDTPITKIVEKIQGILNK
jgi:DNA-binding response OmpR family regulator